MRQILLLLFLIPLALFAQKAPNWHPPLDIPLVLSGSFGELRSNHFHSGWDLKTDGVEGKKVYSIEAGYVSRIRVGAYGFGRALYVVHPNGYTSVYAHLQVFNSEIEAFLKERQYQTESFEQDFFPPSYRLKVERGQVIALSGNSGGSGGPHLHFEIRDTKTEHTINPYLVGFSVEDHKRPLLDKLRLVPLNSTSTVNGSTKPQTISLVHLGNGQYKPKLADIRVQGNIGVEVEAYDQQDGAYNKNGLYAIKMKLDDQLRYHFEVSSYAFDQTRYINAHINFQQKYCCRDVLNRLYVIEGSKLNLYPTLVNRGILSFDTVGQHIVQVDLLDFQGNVTSIELPLTAETGAESVSPSKNGVFSYNQLNFLKKGQVQVVIPEGILYRDAPAIFEEQSPCSRCLTNVYKIGKPDEPLHSGYEITWNVNIPDRLRSKVVMASLSSKDYPRSEGGSWQGNQFVAKTRQFGRFALVVDSIPPAIVSLNVPQNANLSKSSAMKFKISDALSGIKSYRAEVDGRWILMEFDGKNALLYHQFDNTLGPGSHQLVLKVVDGVGNEAIYRADFSK